MTNDDESAAGPPEFVKKVGHPSRAPRKTYADRPRRDNTALQVR